MEGQPHDILDENLKNTIQTLYEIQSITHGYAGDITHPILTSKITSLTDSLVALSLSATSVANHPALQIPPEIIQYVDEGRNPDIYSREFVELVQKGNMLLKGKTLALRGFADVLGEEVGRTWPELRGAVEEMGRRAGGVGERARIGGEGQGNGEKVEERSNGEIKQES
ncbi:RNA polymerase II mediator complex subunit [Agyrium rufum]|nr:RNA polymerase II mediator complex subunit [Agyrium rufum]